MVDLFGSAFTSIFSWWGTAIAFAAIAAIVLLVKAATGYQLRQLLTSIAFALMGTGWVWIFGEDTMIHYSERADNLYALLGAFGALAYMLLVIMAGVKPKTRSV